jgi:hypothetical protein
MKRLLLLSLAAAAVSCNSSSSRQYENNDLVLAVGHSARDACSCAFVMEMDDAFCTAWLKASPDVAKWSVDRQAKTAEAHALTMWSAKARYVGPRVGCVLE